ncbi:MAG TPA: DUF4124 domain-containing protein [Gammaproteobacteria bacterium]
MTRRTCAFRFVSLLLSGLLGHSIHAAETVYTWTDAQGVRHYSQYPPVDEDQPAETLRIETAPGAADEGDRLQTIRDVARDLETARQQREEQRARSAPPPAPVEEEIPPVEVVPYPYGSPYPPPYPYPYPPPHRPRPPKPDEPEDPDPQPPPNPKPPRSGARVMP